MSQRFENGTTVPVSALAADALIAGADIAATGAFDAGAGQEESLPAAGVSPFLEEVTRQSGAADSALASRDVDGAVARLEQLPGSMRGLLQNVVP